MSFLMIREVARFQQFTAALNDLPVNFPPGVLPGDDRFQNLAFTVSDGDSDRSPWHEGQGPWPDGVEWQYVEDPVRDWLGTEKRENQGVTREPRGEPRGDGRQAVHA